MTPTRCSVLITSESGDELISLREIFIGRAEQHLPQLYHITERTRCTTSELVGEQFSGPWGKSCMDWTLWKVVFGLRIQQSSLVDPNELHLLSVPWNVALCVLTRDRMMSSL